MHHKNLVPIDTNPKIPFHSSIVVKKEPKIDEAE